MIKYVKQKDLDVTKYDTCIEKSIQSRVYAFSWYLNIVADSWDVLVYKDFEAVLPIPYMRAKRYLFQKKIIQPFFCQQLGVFSINQIPDNIKEEMVDDFLEHKPKSYQFNSQNFLKNSSNFIQRVNYILSLKRSREDIALNYSSNLKRNLKKAVNNELNFVHEVKTTLFFNFIKEHAHFNITEKQLGVLKEITLSPSVKTFGITQDNQLVALGCFVFCNNRITHLLSISNARGKNIGASHFLIDSVIKTNSNSNKVLDFEGSMIEGVAKFYQSFGAEEEKYFSIV